MDQSPPPSPQRSQARGRRNERDHRILESPTRRRIAPPTGLAPPPSLRFQNLPAHLAQQLAALPALPARRGYSRHPAPAPAPASAVVLAPVLAPVPAPALAQYQHLPAHLAQQLAALPPLPLRGHHYNHVCVICGEFLKQFFVKNCF